MINYIKTRDIECASTLHTLGIPIDGIYSSEERSPDNQPIMLFYFKEDPKTKQLMDDYYNKKLLVEPGMLLLNRKEIITRLKAEQRNAR